VEAGPGDVEWCERGLLARIHRMTLGRLRQEIEPVAAADFIRFLLRWQHVAPGTQLHGADGVAAVLGQLQGLELPGPAWETSVLPARIAQYAPADLEQLCLSGLVAWGRLSRKVVAEEDEVLATVMVPLAPPTAFERALREPQGERIEGPFALRLSKGGPELPQRWSSKRAAPGKIRSAGRSRQAPSRQAALAFLLREELSFWLPEPSDADPAHPAWELPGLSAAAGEVAEYLARRGASFLTDVARGVHRLPAEVEDALWELVTRGLVSGDGVAGLRVLLQPEAKRRPPPKYLQAVHPGLGSGRAMPVGRWSLWGEPEGELPSASERVERIAWQLLRRYGVVFRDLLARERALPPWRELLGVYRRLEARGEIRGGRFVASFIGEQYALPAAVDALRAGRRSQAEGEVVIVNSGDPLNLVGILTPGSRISPFSNQAIAYRDGIPVESGPLGVVQSRLQFQRQTAAAR
jgi:ATP-dependent Lhr-like helicase